MAATYTAYFNGIAFGNTKNMAAVLNNHASNIIRIRRVGLLNAQTAAVTGVLCSIEFRAFFTGSPGLTGPTTITPTKHDSTNGALTSIVTGHAGTIAGTPETLRRIFWSSDEAAITGNTMDEFETFVPLNIIWDAGYGDANVQALTLRQDEMAMVYNVSGAAGLLDTWIEFTQE